MKLERNNYIRMSILSQLLNSIMKLDSPKDLQRSKVIKYVEAVTIIVAAFKEHQNTSIKFKSELKMITFKNF